MDGQMALRFHQYVLATGQRSYINGRALCCLVPEASMQSDVTGRSCLHTLINRRRSADHGVSESIYVLSVVEG